MVVHPPKRAVMQESEAVDAARADEPTSARLHPFTRAAVSSRLAARLLSSGPDGLRSNLSIAGSIIEERPSQEGDTHSVASASQSIAEPAPRMGVTAAPPAPATA
jgi:hypothetical protein